MGHFEERFSPWPERAMPALPILRNLRRHAFVAGCG
jgi:hypothetical protein